MADVLTRMQALDVCARAAHGAIQGYLNGVGFVGGLGYDELSEGQRDFILGFTRRALDGHFPDGSAYTDVGELTAEQNRARDRLFYVVARATMTELFVLGLTSELGVSDGPV